MQAEQLRSLIRRDTFQPFRLFLKDGRIFDLPQFGLMLVFNTYVKVGLKAPNEPRPIIERTVRVPLELIYRVEQLSPAAIAQWTT
jgi:hypothetical protein